MRGRLLVGTSGFAYASWRPGFYPQDLKSREMLRFYSSRLPSVEINNTFYRTPNEKVLQQWREQTPADFALTLKAPQRITHIARLKEVDEPVSAFLGVARTLGTRLGCILFQLPPSMRYEPERLEAFLSLLPGDPFRFAMEFRHASWAEGDARARLAANAVAWCVADTDESDAEWVETAPAHVYVRLRKTQYDDEALRTWAARARETLAGGSDVYLYFKHEDQPTGARWAERVRELADG